MWFLQIQQLHINESTAEHLGEKKIVDTCAFHFLEMKLCISIVVVGVALCLLQIRIFYLKL